MGDNTTTDNEHSDKQSGEGDGDNRVVAAEKKVARKVAKKKAAKKTSKKKAATGKKKSKASSVAAGSAPAPATAPPPPAPAPEPAFSSPAEEEPGGGNMRGIIALWGPLAIIVLLIVVSRVNDEQAAAPSGLTASLESAESIARDVVEDVQDALTGGDPQAATALESGVAGQIGTGNSKSDLAAAFDDSGVSTPPVAPKSASTATEPWGPSDQTTTPASVSGVPAALPPNPENPWAPVDPRALAAMPGPGAPPGPAHQGYPPQGQGYPPQGQAYPPQGQGYPPQGQGYPPQGQGYPPQGQGYPPQGQGSTLR